MIRRGRQPGRFAAYCDVDGPTVGCQVYRVLVLHAPYYMLLLETSRVAVPYGVELRTHPVEAETFQGPGAATSTVEPKRQRRNETGKRSKGNGRACKRAATFFDDAPPPFAHGGLGGGAVATCDGDAIPMRCERACRLPALVVRAAAAMARAKGKWNDRSVRQLVASWRGGRGARARLRTAGKGKAPSHPLIIDARLRLGSRAVMLGLGTSGLGSASRGGAARPSGQLASSDTVLFTVTSDIFFFFFLFRP